MVLQIKTMQNLDTNNVILPSYNKLENVAVAVSFRKPGNVVSYFNLDFEIFQKGNSYKAVPVFDQVNKRLVTLPDVLLFSINDGVLISELKHKDLIVDIAKELTKRKIIENTKCRD
jgi:hypothetical protein